MYVCSLTETRLNWKSKAIQSLENIQKFKTNNSFLNNTWLRKEITREIRKYLKLKNSKYTTYQNLCSVTYAVPRGNVWF